MGAGTANRTRLPWGSLGAVMALCALLAACGRTPLAPLGVSGAGGEPSTASGGRGSTGGGPATGGAALPSGGIISVGGIFPTGGQPPTGGDLAECFEQSRSWSPLPDACRAYFCECGADLECGPKCWAYLGCVATRCERFDPLCAIEECRPPDPALLQELSDVLSNTACSDFAPFCNGPTLPVCGNGVVDGLEECDPTAPTPALCEEVGLRGIVSCTPDCRLDFSGCKPLGDLCGNGFVDPGETCDPSVPVSQSCAFLGLSGFVSCNEDCTLDVSRCLVGQRCGNGQLDPGEECDGMLLPEPACDCLPDCTLDRESCLPQAACGNGVRDPGEACDGTDLGDLSCQAVGLNGALACMPDCTLDVNRCTVDPDQPETCASCGLTQCPRQIDACLGDPNCPSGVACMAERCGADADTSCTLSCFGNPDSAVRALNVFACTASACGEQCLTQPLVPL